MQEFSGEVLSQVMFLMQNFLSGYISIADTRTLEARCASNIDFGIQYNYECIWNYKCGSHFIIKICHCFEVEFCNS
jgi:hypothetical protein